MSLTPRNAGQWAGILTECGVAMSTSTRWAPAFSALMVNGALSAGEAELDDFLGQVLHECGMLQTLTENLNYSATALVAKFSRERISIADAQRYGRVDGVHPANQQAIANCIYGGPWGRKNLGNTEPTDGWDMRGQGPIQITGRTNIVGVGKIIGVDLSANPFLLSKDPHVGLAATIAWWEGHLPDTIMGDLIAVTKRVNGGNNGLDDRGRITRAAARALMR